MVGLPLQKLGEYVLQEPIGAGGFGEVWRACHHAWAERVVAVKIPTQPRYVRQLRREGLAGQDLSHPGIVRLLAFDPYADPPYLVSEYVPGSNLRAWIDHGPLPVRDAIAVTSTILQALAYAHGQGVVHGDLKPENVLVHQRAASDGFGVRGTIRLTDFSVGPVVSRVAVDSILMSSSLARDGMGAVIGTVDYLSPEQRAGEAADPTSDLYAVGVVLYEMLTGSKPAGMELPSEVNPRVPRHLDQVIRQALSRRKKRFGSAADFIRALTAAPPEREALPRVRQRSTPPQPPRVQPSRPAVGSYEVTGGQTPQPTPQADTSEALKALAGIVEQTERGQRRPSVSPARRRADDQDDVVFMGPMNHAIGLTLVSMLVVLFLGGAVYGYARHIGGATACLVVAVALLYPLNALYKGFEKERGSRSEPRRHVADKPARADNSIRQAIRVNVTVAVIGIILLVLIICLFGS